MKQEVLNLNHLPKKINDEEINITFGCPIF